MNQFGEKNCYLDFVPITNLGLMQEANFFVNSVFSEILLAALQNVACCLKLVACCPSGYAHRVVISCGMQHNACCNVTSVPLPL